MKKFYAKKQKLAKTENFIPEVLLNEEYKTNVCKSAHLGKKGYTIPKQVLTENDLAFLIKDLTVKPVVFGPGAVAPETEFAVYRENANKIYIPRFYGIQRYGLPSKSEICEGDDIDVPFEKPLRDYQEEIIKIYMDYVNRDSCQNVYGNGGILEVPTGKGKTVMGLKIISLLRKKTLIIVHKEFLMNQWIERIEEFLPTARVGKIQGPTFDIEGKDIVIGMIQTIYDKEYPVDAFTSFGLTLVDEVHRIGSEQFSRTLLKTITPYMLGISATVDRKDKLTKVLFMFIGEKIYSQKTNTGHDVCVRAINYVSTDREFNEVEYDFRGSPKYSTMISKLCEFGPRSDFIVRVIGDLIEENPDNQIMILCHNRSLLKYLYDAIEYKKIASVGYYLGGMKQCDLKETEGKQIVLATYAMAAEALDIKTLSSLVMVTPKTDITQSVGRILRVKHENPIIVDIVDSHDLFQNQWKQRRVFYKKANYRIRQIDSRKYTTMSLDWKNDKTWTHVFEPKEMNEEMPKCLEEAPIRKCLIKMDDL
jgi:superfamily II DNA or RNA helicase